MRKLVLIALLLSALAFGSQSLAGGRAACRLSWYQSETRHVCYAEQDLFSLGRLFSLSAGLEASHVSGSYSLSPYVLAFLGFGDFWLSLEGGLVYLPGQNSFGLRHAVSFGVYWR